MPEFKPSTVKELFAESIAELQDPNSGNIEGHFRALGYLTFSSMADEVTYGSPADSDVHYMVTQLQDAIHHSPEEVSARLTGILDIVFHAASVMTPQIDEAEYDQLAKIEKGGVLLEEVHDYVFPPAAPPENKGGVTVFSIPMPNNLVITRWVGRETCVVELTPKGREAIKLYLNRKQAQR